MSEFWRLTNLLALWSKTEWQAGNAAQLDRDTGYWLGVLLHLGKRIGDAPFAVIQVAFCDVAMAGKQTRAAKSNRVGLDERGKRLETWFKKNGYSRKDVSAALQKFICDPDNPAWEALLTDSPSYSVVDPYGNKSNELGTIIRLKVGGCGTHRIFPHINRRMATYWRQHIGYEKVSAYLKSIERDGLAPDIEVSKELASIAIRNARKYFQNLANRLEDHVKTLPSFGGHSRRSLAQSKSKASRPVP
jgi:hypothetical protein